MKSIGFARQQEITGGFSGDDEILRTKSFSQALISKIKNKKNQIHQQIALVSVYSFWYIYICPSGYNLNSVVNYLVISHSFVKKKKNIKLVYFLNIVIFIYKPISTIDVNLYMIELLQKLIK